MPPSFSDPAVRGLSAVRKRAGGQSDHAEPAGGQRPSACNQSPARRQGQEQQRGHRHQGDQL